LLLLLLLSFLLLLVVLSLLLFLLVVSFVVVATADVVFVAAGRLSGNFSWHGVVRSSASSQTPPRLKGQLQVT